jgi:hypothetical protein
MNCNSSVDGEDTIHTSAISVAIIYGSNIS